MLKPNHYENLALQLGRPRGRISLSVFFFTRVLRVGVWGVCGVEKFSAHETRDGDAHRGSVSVRCDVNAERPYPRLRHARHLNGKGMHPPGRRVPHRAGRAARSRSVDVGGLRHLSVSIIGLIVLRSGIIHRRSGVRLQGSMPVGTVPVVS